MGAIADIWKSERGLIMVALIIAVTVLSALGVTSPQQWLDYTKWIFLTYAASKTVTGTMEIAAKSGAGSNTPAPEITGADTERWQAAEAILDGLFRRSAAQGGSVPPADAAKAG
jgi:hypothetical protein